MALTDQLDSEEVLWKIAAAGVGLAAAVVTRSAIRALWRGAKDEEPPDDPASPEVSWGDAIAWAALSGLAVGVAELVARRSTAIGWERSQGHLPPSLARTQT